MSKRIDAIGMFWQDHAVIKKTKGQQPKRQAPEPTWLRDDYLPGLEAAMAFKDVDLMTNEELIVAALEKHVLIYDIECYWNYFLVAFMSITTGKVIYFEINDGETMSDPRIGWILRTFTTVGFNSINYDNVMASLAVGGLKQCRELKVASDWIIKDDERPYQIYRKTKCKALKIDNVDLIEVAPLRESLKIYGGRLHTKRMQDLPFHESSVLSPYQKVIVRHYCCNDLRQTLDLFHSLKDPLKLRTEMSERYRTDLRSKSDAQVAEAVIEDQLIKAGVNKRDIRPPKIAIGTKYKYKVPSFIKFQSPLLNWALDIVRRADFVVGEEGAIEVPDLMKGTGPGFHPDGEGLSLQINNSTYTLGIGGLHSTEKSVTHKEDENYLIIDRDVTSYYPFIILNQGLFPKHLGPAFLRAYRAIVNERVAAKAKAANESLSEAIRREFKSIADSLKITVNGSFGKFGSKYSFLYSPDFVIQTTITGQLLLLMMIERLEFAGIQVISANTDGIVFKCPRHRYDEVTAMFKAWEKETNFETEETQYLAVSSRDVNSYVAIKKKYDKVNNVWLSIADGAKTKGAYFNPWNNPKAAQERLSKNPNRSICMDAIEAFLGKGTPIEQTIMASKDITKFVSIQRVKNGAVKVWEETPIPAHNTREELIKMADFHENQGGWIRPDHGELEVISTDEAYEAAKAFLSKPLKYDYLGKAVRWYHAKGEKGMIVNAGNGNKIGKTDGAVPCMEFPDQFPEDMDYDWYIDETRKLMEMAKIEA